MLCEISMSDGTGLRGEIELVSSDRDIFACDTLKSLYETEEQNRIAGGVPAAPGRSRSLGQLHFGMGTVNTMCRKQIDFRKILEQGLGLGAANRRTNPAEPRPNGALWELAVTEFSVCSTRGRVLQYSGPRETAAGGPGGNLTPAPAAAAAARAPDRIPRYCPRLRLGHGSSVRIKLLVLVRN